MAQSAFGLLGRLGWASFLGVVLLGCGAPEDPKQPITEKQSALTTVLFNPFFSLGVASYAEAVAIGDLDGDGRKDVAVTSSTLGGDAGNLLHVFLQNTNGSFKPKVTYQLGNLPQTIDVGDVSGDGRDDVVVGIANGATTYVGVLLQNASGTLNPMVTYPTASSRQIKIGDFNSDGRMDVAGIINGALGDGLDIFLQTESGTLAAPVTYHVPHGGWDELDVGDVNGDGRTDLIVMSGSGYLAPSLSVVLQNTDGTMAPSVPYSIGSGLLPHGIAVGDTNGDGRSDVVVSYGGNRPASRVGRLLQNDMGTLDPIVSYPSYDVPEAIVLADVDLDGRKDVLVTHGGWQRLGVYRQAATGELGAEELYTLPNQSHYSPQGLAVGDINGDGLPDAVVVDNNHGTLVVLRHVDDVAPTVTVTAPVGGAFLTGVPITVGWTASDNAGLASFALSASFDGGATYSAIAGCTNVAGNARQCNWATPGPATPGVRIRVTARDLAGNTTSAETVIDLVAPTLSVTAPTAGTTLYVGAPVAINWTSNIPASATLLVELSRDGGASYTALAAAAPNAGSFGWVVTGPDTADARVRVTSSSPTVSGTSGAFAIVTPVVAVTSPVAGTTAYAGNAVAITWAHNLPGVATALIELSRDGGASFETLAAAAPNTGGFLWLASGPDAGAALARVTLNGPPIVSGVSGLFAVVTPVVTVASPSAGASLYAGTSQAITWSTNLPASAAMNIELSRDGGSTFETVSAAAPNTGSFAWTVTGPDTATALVRVSSSDPATASGTSDLFGIVSPVLAVTGPTDGVSWLVGTAQAITWTSNLPGSATVLIELSRDGGASYETLAPSAPNSGSFAWNATGPTTSSAVVRVSASSPATATGTSGVFSIANAALAVTAPATGASWTIGTARSITWSTNLPPTDTVRIELSRNDGTSYTTLAASAPNSGSFAWTATGPATTSALVRISANGTPAASAVSGRFSLVKAAVTVTSPNTLVTWVVGSVHAITWTHNVGAGAQFKIEVSRNSGSTWSLITAAAPASGATSGSFDWTVAAPRSDTSRIRVTWTGNTAVNDASNVNFRIR